MSERPDLVSALKAKQSALEESDGQFAARLGVDREMWRRVRVGKSRPGEKTIAGAVRAFPDLVLHTIDFFMASDANRLSSEANVQV